MLFLGAGPLLFRTYLKFRGKWRGGYPFTVSISQLIIGTLCIVAAFFAADCYDILTAGLLALIGSANLLIVVTAGGKMPIAVIGAIALGVWLGFSGLVTARNKASIFLELIDKNAPDFWISVAFAIVVAAVSFIFLRMFQDLLVAAASFFEWVPITILIVALCLTQASLLATGSSLQPIITDFLNRE
jgi:hypothetical protein